MYVNLYILLYFLKNRQTDRSQFTSILLQNNDLIGLGKNLQCHCLSSEDDLIAVALTNQDFNSTFAKKMLREIILNFRDYFSFNPSLY